MKRAILQLIIIVAMAGSSAVWAEEDSALRCGLNLGSSDLEHTDSSNTNKEYSAYKRSLAGPSIEKLERLTVAETFKIPATDRLLPDLLTLANFGCIWRF